MRKKLYLVVGASGTGKDYVVDKLCNELGMKKVISRTTRKPRYQGENTHQFISNEQADKEYGHAIARTVFNGNRYYTLAEDLYGADFYIIDPKGVSSINDNILEHFNYETVYIKVNWWTRFKNMKKRGDSLKNILKRLVNDYKEFKGFKGQQNFKCSNDFYNYIRKNNL